MKKLVDNIKAAIKWLNENPDEKDLIISDACILAVFFAIATAALYIAVEFYGGK